MITIRKKLIFLRDGGFIDHHIAFSQLFQDLPNRQGRTDRVAVGIDMGNHEEPVSVLNETGGRLQLIIGLPHHSFSLLSTIG